MLALQAWRQKAQGDLIIVRYADDAVLGFQHEYEAQKFLQARVCAGQLQKWHTPACLNPPAVPSAIS
jgi:hypothetical protein